MLVAHPPLANSNLNRLPVIAFEPLFDVIVRIYNKGYCVKTARITECVIELAVSVQLRRSAWHVFMAAVSPHLASIDKPLDIEYARALVSEILNAGVKVDVLTGDNRGLESDARRRQLGRTWGRRACCGCRRNQQGENHHLQSGESAKCSRGHLNLLP